MPAAITLGFPAKFLGVCSICANAIKLGDMITAKPGRPGKSQQRSYWHIGCDKRAIEARTQTVSAIVKPAPVETKTEQQAADIARMHILVNEWIDVVQATRKLASDQKALIVVSPRASIKGAQLLRGGVSPKAVVEATFGRYTANNFWSIVGQRVNAFAMRPHQNNPEAEARWAKLVAAAGVSHKKFSPLVMLMTSLGEEDRNIWLAGPAGSGKTTAARKLAEAMGLPFEFNGAIDTEYKLSGFVDANGRVISTAFRRIWEFGGVYLFDECDASMAGALLAFNAALANGHAAFPDGTIKRHQNCYIIAAANTWGFGGDANYVGRAKLDAAFLDRFVTLSWDYDQDLERKIALAA